MSENQPVWGLACNRDSVVGGGSDDKVNGEEKKENKKGKEQERKQKKRKGTCPTTLLGYNSLTSECEFC